MTTTTAPTSTNLNAQAAAPVHRATQDPLWVRIVLIGTALAFLLLFLALPLLVVFAEALGSGWRVYFRAIADPVTMSAINLTLLTSVIAVPLNLIFGVAAAWALAKFRFLGRNLLITIIDLPFAVSPVISGLIFILVFGRQGWLGHWLRHVDVKGILSPPAIILAIGLVGLSLTAIWRWARNRNRQDPPKVSLFHAPYLYAWAIPTLFIVLLLGWRGWLQPWHNDVDIQVIFAPPGIILATIFVTFPFVARELIPLMEEQGSDAEQAALSLGASGWQTFWRVTLPNIKWALLYGVILCNARAMGEFGAVSVVSGNIRGRTNTLPLHVEILHNENQFAAAFAVASLLALLALVTLIAKSILEWRVHQRQRSDELESASH